MITEKVREGRLLGYNYKVFKFGVLAGLNRHVCTGRGSLVDKFEKLREVDPIFGKDYQQQTNLHSS
jgi:hypothetical protein